MEVEKLYHYTKFDSLCNIIDTDEFILSDFKNANDYKEKAAQRKDEINNYKYISFTYNRDSELYSYTNPPLWHFYAEQGHGVCICFDKEKLFNKISIIKDGFINYRNGVTHIDNQDILDYLMEKRKQWDFEEEYRAIVDSSLNNISNILDCISTIYIGPEVKDEAISELIKKLPTDINIKQMYIDSTDGRLNNIDFRNKVIAKASK